MIMTDQDHDGSHIKGLIMNFFHTLFPTLLKVPGFLLEFITPIIKVCARPPQRAARKLQPSTPRPSAAPPPRVRRPADDAALEGAALRRAIVHAGQQGAPAKGLLHHARVRGLEGEPGRLHRRMVRQVLQGELLLFSRAAASSSPAPASHGSVHAGRATVEGALVCSRGALGRRRVVRLGRLPLRAHRLQGLGTSTREEAREYFAAIQQHRKQFVWHGARCRSARVVGSRSRPRTHLFALRCAWRAGDADGQAIEMAFSKKKVDDRKEWLSGFVPGTFLDNSASNISYSDFIHKVCARCARGRRRTHRFRSARRAT